MKIKEKMHGDVAVLTISGKLMGGEETHELHNHIKRLVADDVIKVVIDLSKIKWINSLGLGVLMASWSTVAKKGGNIKLVGATEKIKSLLIISQIITFFETPSTVERAVAGFKKEK